MFVWQKLFVLTNYYGELKISNPYGNCFDINFKNIEMVDWYMSKIA